MRLSAVDPATRVAVQCCAVTAVAGRAYRHHSGLQSSGRTSAAIHFPASLVQRSSAAPTACTARRQLAAALGSVLALVSALLAVASLPFVRWTLAPRMAADLQG